MIYNDGHEFDNKSAADGAQNQVPNQTPNPNEYHYAKPAGTIYTEQSNISYSPTPSAAYNKPPKAHKPHRVLYGALIVTMAFAVSVAGGALGNKLTSADAPAVPDAVSSQNDAALPDGNTAELFGGSTTVNTASGSNTINVAAVAAATADSVVEITTEQLQTGSRMQQLVTTGAGSGVIISQNGYIITNNHVIADASKITVTLRDGTQYDAQLIGTDAKTDIAVIKVDAENLTVATMGTSAGLTVGQPIVVIGNPLGQLGGTVTNGIISALDRSITVDGTSMTLLQTNAAINQGNSGGGMFDSEGKLIAVVNAKSLGTGIEGLGFAIPIDTAKAVANDLIKYGFVQGRVEMGITLIDVDDEITAWMYKVNNTGVYIYSVTAGSSADEGGLQSGDRIISIDENVISSSNDVTAYLDTKSVGDTVSITIDRNGRTGTATVTLQQAGSSGNTEA